MRTKWWVVRKFDNGNESKLTYYATYAAAKKAVKYLGTTYKHEIVPELDDTDED